MFKTRMQKTIASRETDFEIPEYTLGKRRVRKAKKKHIPKPLMITVMILAAIVLVLYVPPIFFGEKVAALPSTAIPGDDTKLQASIAYMRNNPDLDFDGDGLTNEQELEHSTNVYGIDNDNDGVTDYAELYITETNPCLYDDAIVEYVKGLGGEANAPFKIHNVVMWADDYESKAKGSVVLLNDGYRFSNFTGWVQFPQGKVAYKIENGYHVQLKSNKNGQIYIDCDKEMETVQVFDEELPATYLVYLFGNKYYIDDNAFGKILNFILPNYGTTPLTCKKVAVMDVDGSGKETAKANPIAAVDVSNLSESRFGLNQTTLDDLADVYAEIDRGNNVVISLYSHTTGEALVVCYGYTNKNNLLIADAVTGKELGYLNITVRSSRLLDSSGNIQQYEWFDFSGCGYSSAAKHRIAFPISVHAA